MFSFTPVSYLGPYHRPPTSSQDRDHLFTLERQSANPAYQLALLENLYPPSPYPHSNVMHPLSPLELLAYEQLEREQRRAAAIRRQQEDAERRRIALIRQQEEYDLLVSLQQEVAHHRRLLVYRQKMEQERFALPLQPQEAKRLDVGLAQQRAQHQRAFEEQFRAVKAQFQRLNQGQREDSVRQVIDPLYVRQQQQEAERLRVDLAQQHARRQRAYEEHLLAVSPHIPRLNQEQCEADGVRQVTDHLGVRQVVEEPVHCHVPSKSTQIPQSREPSLWENMERLSNILLDVIGGSGEAAQSKPPVSKPSVPAVKVDSAASKTLPPLQGKSLASQEPSVREQLESRFRNEYEVEIRDVIKALLTSLTTSTGTSSAVKKDNEQVPESSKSKGKGKAVSFDLPISVGTSKDVVDSLDTVRNINTSFTVLESDFVFPARLDFEHAAVHLVASSESDRSASSKLAYTSNNAPLRYYENALSALLTQLDAVESFGSEDVRIKRKEVVERVERALEDIEREVEQRMIIWVRKVERESVKLREPPEKDRATEVAVLAFTSDAASLEGSSVTVKERAPVVTQDEQPIFPAEVIPAAVENKSDDVESQSPVAEDDTVSATIDFQTEHLASEEPPASDVIPSHSDNVDITGEPALVSSEALQPPVEAVSPTPSSTSALEPEPVDTFLLPASPVLQPQSSLPAHSDSEDAVVIDEEATHTDGETWSEVEA